MKGPTRAHRNRGLLAGLPAALWVALPGRVAGAEGAAGSLPPALDGAEVIGQVTLSLVVVVAALLAFAWVLRRLNRIQARAGGVSLRVVGALSLGARERILVVEAEGTRLLVGVSPGGLRTLHVLGEAPAVPSEGRQEPVFSIEALTGQAQGRE